MFEYLAKGAKHREQAVAEDQVCAVVRSLRRRRGGGDQLLAYRSGPALARCHRGGHQRLPAGGIRRRVHRQGLPYLACDRAGGRGPGGVRGRQPDSDAARKRAIARVVREVADYLGNTPAVARASYIDPRIIELYEDGSHDRFRARRPGQEL